jgi:competence protein ComEC
MYKKMFEDRKLGLGHVTILVCLIVFAVATSAIAKDQDGLLKIYFLDVGQGDAELIVTPSGQQILIDGGPTNEIVGELGEIMPFYDSTLDMILVSHKHDDHISGLMGVLDKYTVNEIVDTNRNFDTAGAKEWQIKKEFEGAKLINTKAGDEFVFEDGVKITILYPDTAADNYVTKNPNNDSIVAMLEYGNLKVLFVGDAESSVEKQILNQKIDIDADVLKVGHHGSKTSSTLSFLNAVSPSVGVIEVGAKNKYGLPSDVILSRLESFPIKYYRTDVDGTVELSSDGNSLEITK